LQNPACLTCAENTEWSPDKKTHGVKLGDYSVKSFHRSKWAVQQFYMRSWMKARKEEFHRARPPDTERLYVYKAAKHEHYTFRDLWDAQSVWDAVHIGPNRSRESIKDS
jgi:hypothetical protein